MPKAPHPGHPIHLAVTFSQTLLSAAQGRSTGAWRGPAPWLPPPRGSSSPREMSPIAWLQCLEAEGKATLPCWAPSHPSLLLSSQLFPRPWRPPLHLSL